MRPWASHSPSPRLSFFNHETDRDVPVPLCCCKPQMNLKHKKCLEKHPVHNKHSDISHYLLRAWLHASNSYIHSPSMTSKHSLLPAQRSDAAVSRFLSNRDHRACFPSPRSSKIGPFFHQSSPVPDGFWAHYNIEQSVIVAPELGTPNQKLLLSALMEAVRPREKGLHPFQKAGQAVSPCWVSSLLDYSCGVGRGRSRFQPCLTVPHLLRQAGVLHKCGGSWLAVLTAS